MSKIGLLHTTIRGDEKLLMHAAKERGIELELVDVRKQIFNSETHTPSFDLALERCISTTLGMHAITFFESIGVSVVNSSSVANICVDKFATSLKLRSNNVSTVPFAMAFTEEQAAEA